MDKIQEEYTREASAELNYGPRTTIYARLGGAFMTRNVRRTLLVITTLTAPYVLGTAPAHAAGGFSLEAQSSTTALADPSFLMWTKDGDPGGVVGFRPINDFVFVNDIDSDGASVRVEVTNVTKDPNRREYVLADAHNDGDLTSADASMGQPWNLAEGHCFRFRISLIKNGSEIPGSANTQQWRNYNDREESCPGVD